MKHVLGLALWIGVAHSPLGAVVVIEPPARAAKAVRPPAPAAKDTSADDQATLLTLGLGLAVVLLVARTTRQPRTVAV